MLTREITARFASSGSRQLHAVLAATGMRSEVRQGWGRPIFQIFLVRPSPLNRFTDPLASSVSRCLFAPRAIRSRTLLASGCRSARKLVRSQGVPPLPPPPSTRRNWTPWSSAGHAGPPVTVPRLPHRAHVDERLSSFQPVDVAEFRGAVEAARPRAYARDVSMAVKTVLLDRV